MTLRFSGGPPLTRIARPTTASSRVSGTLACISASTLLALTAVLDFYTIPGLYDTLFKVLQ